MTYKVDVVVIGAGVVGLACARRFAMVGLETLVIEKANKYGTGVSSRNSEVIHAGIYYRPDSLKARLCLKGAEAMCVYSDAHQVPYKKTGKWIVASGPEQVERLHQIKSNGLMNGSNQLYFMPKEQIIKKAATLKADEILVSPQTGIIDSHALMTAFVGEVESLHGHLVYSTEIQQINTESGGFFIHLSDQEKTKVKTKILVFLTISLSNQNRTMVYRA